MTHLDRVHVQSLYRRARSTRWQVRIKVPSDLVSLYPTEWACRVSLETSDLRAANEHAAKLRAESTTRFDEQRKALNPEKADQITPELARVLAQRVAATILANDEKLRTDPEVARQLLLQVRQAVPNRLLISGAPASLPDSATEPIDPLEGLPEDVAAELGELNQAMDARAAMQLAVQRAASVLPLAQVEARKLGVEFDTETLGALGMLRECLKTYRKARQEVRRRDEGKVVETPYPAPLPSRSSSVSPAHSGLTHNEAP